MTNLMAHCDTGRVSEAEVMSVEEPDFTKTWHPISHAKVVTSLNKACEERGLVTRERTYSLSKDGGKMFGVWDIDTGDSDGCYSLGFRNSTDKSMAYGVTAGNKVFVCDNMAFSGEYISFRKHTSGLNLDQLLWMADKALEVTMEKCKAFTDWHRNLKEVELTCDDMKVLTFDCMKNGVFAPSKFKEFGECVKAEYELSKERSLYTLHGGVTRMVRGRSLFQVSDSTRKLTGVCDDFMTARAA